MKHLLTLITLAIAFSATAQNFGYVKEQLFEENPQAAKSELMKILSEFPESAEAHYWMGVSLSREFALSDVSSHDGAKLMIDAGIMFEKSKFLNPNCAQMIDDYRGLKNYSNKAYNLAIQNYKEDQIELSFTNFKMSIMANDWMGTQDYSAMYYAGHCANKLNDYESANTYLTKVCMNEPENEKAVKELLKTKMASEQPEQIISFLKSSLVQHPESEYLWYELMSFSLKIESYDNALSAAQTLSHMDSNNAQNLSVLASLYDKTGNQEKAIESYRKSLQIKSDDARATFNLGVLVYNEAISMKNMGAGSNNNIMVAQKLDEAQEILNTAQKLDPKNSDIPTILGNIEKMK